jgi:nucleotide-binding universal stress UspA family protein
VALRSLRILLPLDGSSEAESVLGAILPLAGRRPLRLTLLEAIPRHPGRAGSEVEKYLTKVAQALRRPDIDVRWETCLGDPASSIVAHSISGNVDFVAMATHGRGGVGRLLLGSVTEQVLRRATMPLVACRPGSRMEGWTHVVALDGSPRAEGILDDLLPLTRVLGATLHLLHVAEKSPGNDARRYLKKVALQVKARGVNVATAIRQGSAPAEILRYAGEARAGMIALATHGRTGLERVLMGSVAEAVLRKSPCPVLLRRDQRESAPLEVGVATS